MRIILHDVCTKRTQTRQRINASNLLALSWAQYRQAIFPASHFVIGTPDSTFTPTTNAANSEVFRLRGAGQYQIQVETTVTVSSDFAIQITLQGSTGNSFQTAISGSAVAGTPAVNPLVLVNEIGVVTYIAVTSTYTWTGALNSVVRVYQRFASGSKRGRNPFKACSALVYLSRAGSPSHGTNAMHS